jgi:hypothetical protein
LNDFLARKKNCASRFEAKKTAMEDERLSVASRLVASRLYCTVLFWLFWEINGDKIATVLVFKSADN